MSQADDSDPAILHSIFHTLPLLCKSRPALAPLLVSSITSWTPAALQFTDRPLMQIRSVERALRLIMAHLVK